MIIGPLGNNSMKVFYVKIYAFQETVPCVLALFYLADGDPVKSIIYGANFGRDADTIATMVGSPCGAYKGVDGLRPEWVEK